MNLVGFAIGNGEMDEIDQVNLQNASHTKRVFRSILPSISTTSEALSGKSTQFSYLYAKLHVHCSDYDGLYDCCKDSLNGDQLVYCDFTQWYTLDQYGNAAANQYDDQASLTLFSTYEHFLAEAAKVRRFDRQFRIRSCLEHDVSSQ